MAGGRPGRATGWATGGKSRMESPSDWPVEGLLAHIAGRGESGFRVVDFGHVRRLFRIDRLVGWGRSRRVGLTRRVRAGTGPHQVHQPSEKVGVIELYELAQGRRIAGTWLGLDISELLRQLGVELVARAPG